MATSTTRILIVEDDPLTALLMEAMVEDMGYWVIGPMRNLRDGLDHAKYDVLDFALLDFNLGAGTDSIPIAEALSARGIPFAFSTGTAPETVHAAFADAAILRKPVQPSDLERVLPI